MFVVFIYAELDFFLTRIESRKYDFFKQAIIHILSCNRNPNHVANATIRSGKALKQSDNYFLKQMFLAVY